MTFVTQAILNGAINAVFWWGGYFLGRSKELKKIKSYLESRRELIKFEDSMKDKDHVQKVHMEIFDIKCKIGHCLNIASGER